MAALLAAAALAGWALHIEWLKGAVFNGLTMKANTAIGLLLIAAGLLLQHGAFAPKLLHRAGQLCAAAAILLGLLTLSQYIVGWDLGIDQWHFQEEPGALATVSPGRMGVLAAISLTLLGLALLILDWRTPRGAWPAQYLAGIVAALMLIPLVGHSYQVQAFYGILKLTGIAANTALALFLLSSGILLVRPGRGLAALLADARSGGVMARQFLPALLAVFILSWLHVWMQNQGLIATNTSMALLTVTLLLGFVALVLRNARILNLAEASFLDSEAEYRNIFDLSASGHAQIDPFSEQFLRVNRKYCQITGYSADELQAMTVAQLTHPDDRAREQRLLEQMLREQVQEQSYQKRLVRKDGRTIWVQVSVATQYDPAGRPIRMTGVVEEITEHIEAQEALRASEARFRLITEALPSHVWLVRPEDASLEYSNQRWIDYIGIDPREIKDYAELWRRIVHPADLERIQAVWREALRLGQPYEAEVRLRSRADQYHWFLTIALPLMDDQGRITHWLGTSTDIEDHKRAEEQLRLLNETLENRVLERTAQLRALASELTLTEQRERRRLAHLLHDHLQQLLVAAKIRLGLLRQGSDKTSAKPVTEIDELISQAIDASRSLTVELSPPVLYDRGLGSALNWLGRWMQGKHGLWVEVDADPQAEPASEAMRVLLFQIVRELLFNVVKHAGVDRAQVVMLREHHAVRIEVADQGKGFDPAVVNVSRSDGEHFGLFSIQERLALLRGALKIESSPNGGTRVTIQAPIEEQAPEPPVRAVAAPLKPAAPAPPDQRVHPPHPRLHKIRILVADDHEILRKGLVGLLESQEDFDLVGQAADGQAAVELTRQLRPDVVIMDLAMPRMNGIQATRLISDEFPEIRVIGLSMHEKEDMAAAMRDAGAVAYLTKGGPADDLLAAIRADTQIPARR